MHTTWGHWCVVVRAGCGTGRWRLHRAPCQTTIRSATDGHLGRKQRAPTRRRTPTEPCHTRVVPLQIHRWCTLYSKLYTRLLILDACWHTLYLRAMESWNTKWGKFTSFAYTDLDVLQRWRVLDWVWLTDPNIDRPTFSSLTTFFLSRMQHSKNSKIFGIFD